MTGIAMGGGQDAGAISAFGEVGGYSPCGCCGGFHAVYDAPSVGPLEALNADDRGETGSNGKASLTSSEAAAQLSRSNLSWSQGLGQSATVTYAFRSTAPTTAPEDVEGFTRFNDAQMAASQQSLTAWSDVANITFIRVADADGYSNNATILFGNYQSGPDDAAAFAYFPGSTASASASGDVWIDASIGYNAAPVPLGYGAHVLTHEIGHAIGLSHPAAYNAGDGVSISYSADAGYYEDSRQYTVMSYFSETNTGGNFNTASGARQYSAAPLLDDIAAAQRLYGANMTTRTGDTVYGFNATADRAWLTATSAATDLIFALWDAGGADTLDFSGYADVQTIDLRQGAFSNVGGLVGNVAIAVGAVIENAIGGSGADTLNGNSGDNRLSGGAGADTLDGGLGTDTVVFSGARSGYAITQGLSFFTVRGPDGAVDLVRNTEVLQFSDQVVFLAATELEIVSGDLLNNLMVVATRGDLDGAGGDDTLFGAAQADTLDGGIGDDLISSAGGDDVLIGGAGNDVIDGGEGVDLFDIYVETTRAVGQGSTVNLATGTTSGAIGVDRVTHVENISGSRYADALTGDAGANVIDGKGGADTILGGDGADTLLAGPPEIGGGAPDVVKPREIGNGSIAAALNLDPSFDAVPRDGVDVAEPTATVVGVTHGGYEYYAFTASAGTEIVLDIDNAAFDSTLRLFGADGGQLAINDDRDPDGNQSTDSQISFRVPATGVYYVQVGAWSGGSGETVVTEPPPAGQAYTLHVSVPLHLVAPSQAIGSRIEGGGGDDRVIGSSGRDVLFGGDGQDVLQALVGNDNLQGNKGDDILLAGDGADYVFGGQDNDQLFGEGGGDWMNGNLGADVMDGGDGADTMFGGQADDRMQGSLGNDRLVGDLGDDTLSGGGGEDVLEGMAGSDRLEGEAGADLLVGGAGDDTLRGGEGADILVGSDGADLFVLEGGTGPLSPTFGGDAIADFQAGDRLAVDGLAPGGVLWGGAATTYAEALQLADAVLAGSVVTAVTVGVGADVYVFFDGADLDRGADVSVWLIGASAADVGADAFI